jgi:hypothetical protein
MNNLGKKNQFWHFVPTRLFREKIMQNNLIWFFGIMSVHHYNKFEKKLALFGTHS